MAQDIRGGFRALSSHSQQLSTNLEGRQNWHRHRKKKIEKKYAMYVRYILHSKLSCNVELQTKDKEQGVKHEGKCVQMLQRGR